MKDDGLDEGGERFEDLLNESVKAGRRLSPGEKVEATVLVIGSESVFLDVGSRSDGVIPKPELEKDGEAKVKAGDRITVYFKGMRDGSMVFTRRFGSGGAEDRKAGNGAVLRMLSDAREGGVPVEGAVKEAVKGGFAVDIMGQRAFCPISQIDRVYCEDASVHLNRTYGFIVTEFGEEGRNIVVSRRRLLEREAEEKAREARQSVVEGAVYDGVVTSLQKYGAFVDIGGVEGLVHVSEISHLRVNDPRDVLSVGQKVQVTVISADRGSGKISLSIKSMQEDPWVGAAGKFSIGQALKGRVTRIADFGAFVELAPGIDGLLHISRLGGGRRLSSPREVLRTGQEVSVVVSEIDPGRRRISLSLHDQDADEEKEALEDFRLMQGAVDKPIGKLGDLLRKRLGKS